MGDLTNLTMRRMLAVSALLLSVALVLAACGDDDDDTTSVAPAATPTTQASTATTAAAAGGATTTGAASGGYDYGGGSATATTAASGSASATTAAAGSGSATATTAAESDEDSSGTLALADTSAGKVITNGEGRTLYLFTPDNMSTPTCNDTCEQTWPYADKAEGVAAGLDASKLGTVKRADGEEQATYAGWPLYTFSGDAKAGDVNGIGIGGKWFALDATGAQVAKK
jgi:predicted lipoprotein with Yx(FWY)xxD motif